MNKPTVLFTHDTVHGGPIIQQGARGYVRALNHPRLGNCDAHTTVILEIFEDGSFETLNTIYKPLEKADGN